MSSYLDQLNAMPDRAGYTSAAPSTSKKKPTSRGGFLSALISEGGALGGAATGAAVGSVVPGLGTAIGGIIGAGVGAFGGRLAENKVRDDRWGVGDAAKEGALSAVLAGPLKLGKYAITAGKSLKAGSGLAAALASGADDAAKFSLRGALGNKLTTVGDDLAAKSFRFTPTQLKNYKKKFGEDATATIKRYGFETPEDITTKGITTVKAQYDSLVDDIASPISFDDFAASVEKRANKLISAAPSDKQQQGLDLLDELNALRLNYGKGGFNNGQALNKVKNDYDSLVNYTQKAANPNKYSVNKHLADAARETLGSKSPALTETGSELSRLIQLAENATGQAHLGRGNLPISIGNLPLTVAGAGTGGPIGAAAGYVTNAVINSKTGRRAITKGATAAGGKLTAKADGMSVGRKVLAGVTRGQTAEGLVGALMGGQSEGNINEANAMINPAAMTDNTNNIDSEYADPLGNTSGTDEVYTQDEPEQLSPFDPANLEANVTKIIQGGGKMKDVQEYVSLVEALQKISGPSSGPKLSGTQIQQANNATSGLTDLESLAQQIQADPGVLKKSAIPGGQIARALTGTTGYEASKQNVVDVISRLRSGAAITADEAKRYMGLLPGFADTPQTAMAKLQRLNSLLEGFANPQQSQSDLASLQM